MTWRTDPRTEKHYGPLTLVSQTNDDRETAHLVTFSDGRKLRVLPDATSGRMRTVRVKGALLDLESLVGAQGPLVDPDHQEPYLIGVLYAYGLSFERVTDEQTPSEWLHEWFKRNGLTVPPLAWLMDDLEDAGWTIRRAE